MFQIPSWEEDVPDNNVNFTQKIKKKSKSAPGVERKIQNIKEKNNNLNGVIGTPKKRKHDSQISSNKKKKREKKPELDTDELIIDAKRRKFNESIKNDDRELELLFKEGKTSGTPNVKNEAKKLKLKAMLQSHRSTINVTSTGTKLRLKMLERLKAAQFRYLNEKLYTSSGSEAQQLFQSDPKAFATYHQGYQQQLKKWPVKPIDVIVNKIKKMPKSHTIADMGCGEAILSKRVPQAVRSFDLVATAPGVEACDMARTPLLSVSMDVVVYCLALMGTDLSQYLVEANRVLKMGGHLLIAEVESRFHNVENFAKEVQRLGFKLKQLDKSHQVFYFLEFTKNTTPPVKKSKLPVLNLKPCLYKKR